MRLKDKSLLMMGCGNMAGALLARWLENDLINAKNLTILKPSPPSSDSIAAKAVKMGANHITDLSHPYPYDMVILGVKPQILPMIMPKLAKTLGSSPLYLSMLAGVKLKTMAGYFSIPPRLVRFMPNTPVQIGEGVIGYVASDNLQVSEKQEATLLLQTCGFVYELKSEAEMDFFTAYAGSGPAYFYAFIEAMSKTAQSQGITEQEATKLALLTFKGAISLALQSGLSPEILRQNITSKGGVTKAGLNILLNKDNGLDGLVKTALEQATQRSKELGE